jgi:protein TonB
VIRDWRLLLCAVLSVAGHLAFAQGLGQLPRHLEKPARRVVSIRVTAPPPIDPPPEPAQSAPAKTPEVPRERPRARRAPMSQEATPREAPPVDRPTVNGDSTTPIFGVSMESTSQAGRGPSLPIGNSGLPARGERPTAVTPRPAPVQAYEVTTMPLPQGRCMGQYTDEAKRAAIEGTVVLDLVVGEDGRVREVQVVSGLGHGLTEAAVAAARACRFSPGEKDGTPVPVRVRGFKIRFLMENGD